MPFTHTNRSELDVPTYLNHELLPEKQLPLLPPDIKQSITSLGWVGIGIMVALVNEDGKVILLRGRQTPKYQAGTLGPLGETSKQVESTDANIPPLIEQPLSTLYRGITEELGLTEPENLSLRIKRKQAWRINKWPRGDSYPNEWNCAISFAVHVSKDVEELIRTIEPHNDEIMGVDMLSVDAILEDIPGNYRQGTQDWLGQLVVAGLLQGNDRDLATIDFSSVTLGTKDIQVTK